MLLAKSPKNPLLKLYLNQWRGGFVYHTGWPHLAVILWILPLPVLARTAGVSKMSGDVLFVGHRLSNVQRKSQGLSPLGASVEE